MTPQEKAQNLYDRIIANGGCCSCPDDTKHAIEVFCDEIIQLRQMPDAEYVGTPDNMTLIGGIKYWEEVKINIDNININRFQ